MLLGWQYPFTNLLACPSRPSVHPRPRLLCWTLLSKHFRCHFCPSSFLGHFIIIGICCSRLNDISRDEIHEGIPFLIHASPSSYICPLGTFVVHKCPSRTRISSWWGIWDKLATSCCRIHHRNFLLVRPATTTITTQLRGRITGDGCGAFRWLMMIERMPLLWPSDKCGAGLPKGWTEKRYDHKLPILFGRPEEEEEEHHLQLIKLIKRELFNEKSKFWTFDWDISINLLLAMS